MTSPFVIGSNFYHGRCNSRLRRFALSQAGAANAGLSEFVRATSESSVSRSFVSRLFAGSFGEQRQLIRHVDERRRGKILFAICAAAAAAIFTAAATALSGATSELLE